MSIIKRIQLTENGIAQDVDILTSAECVTFEDGDTLQAKLDNGDLASSDVLGDVDGLDGSVVDSLNELNDSAKETSELVSELASRGGVTSALRKEVASNEWEFVSTAPYEPYMDNLVVLDNEMHLVGKSNKTEFCQSHYKYNGSSWESVSTLPYDNSQGSVIVFNNKIHILGGYGTSTGYTAHYKYTGVSWESVSTLPYSFWQGCTVVLNDEIHILGTNHTGNNNSYRYAHYKFNGTSWESVSELPYQFYHGGAVIYNDEIHILGTWYDAGQNLHYKYNGTSWESDIGLRYCFYHGSALVLDNEIHLLGSGYSNATKWYHYKFNGSSWSSVSTLPYQYDCNSAVVYKGSINIVGDDTCSHYRYKDKPTLNGYSKANTEIYLPISTTPITSNLVATDDGYTVTEDGYVEILLNE